MRSGRPAEKGQIENMCSVIRHRGPDDQGIHVEGSLGLGMRRLSIIDLEGGGQPVFNEDRSICVVFNGEIYNYPDLRRKLLDRGHHLQTQSDTEVIVHLYEDEGPDFVEQLNGMFAIALWDSRRRRLVLARDRLGVKPLYYAWTGDGVVFGSELKCLRQAAGVEFNLRPEALLHYFTLGYVPHPMSIYRGIEQLSPAHRLVIEPEAVKLERYWRLKPRIDRTLKYEVAKEQLRDLLTDAVKIRMRSDVPLGAFLSGGVDSSIVVALMAQNSSEPVRTFYIDFDEPGYSERAYASTVAQRYGTRHHELTIRPSALEVLDDLVDHFDEPFGDASAVPTFYVSELTRQHVTVALAGDGGDESFGGYRRYRQILDRRRGARLMRQAAGALGGVISECLPRTAKGRRFLRSVGMSNREFYAVGTAELEARELLSRDVLAELATGSTYSMLERDFSFGDASDPLSPYTCLDLNYYLPDDILVKVDRMSMAHSLEVRGPFLDYRLVELAANFPSSWKISSGDTKVILKDTFATDLPSEVLEPRKRGFSMPLDAWLRGELRSALEEALHSEALATSGLFDMQEMRGLWREHFSGVRSRAGQLWRFLFFYRWWRREDSLRCGSEIRRQPC